jgi:mediator of RNA polymerase II transcription subunit 5
MDGGIGVSQNLRLDSGAGMDAIDDVLNAAQNQASNFD